MARTRVEIPDELLEAIDQRVGPRGRSRFLEIAVREKLDRLVSEEPPGGNETPPDAGYRPWRDRRSTAPPRSTRRTGPTS